MKHIQHLATTILSLATGLPSVVVAAVVLPVDVVSGGLEGCSGVSRGNGMKFSHTGNRSSLDDVTTTLGLPGYKTREN